MSIGLFLKLFLGDEKKIEHNVGIFMLNYRKDTAILKKESLTYLENRIDERLSNRARLKEAEESLAKELISNDTQYTVKYLEKRIEEIVKAYNKDYLSEEYDRTEKDIDEGIENIEILYDRLDEALRHFVKEIKSNDYAKMRAYKKVFNLISYINDKSYSLVSAKGKILTYYHIGIGFDSNEYE